MKEPGKGESLSTQMVYSQILLSLLHAIAPILSFTSQDAFDHIPVSLFPKIDKIEGNQNSKPATVF